MFKGARAVIVALAALLVLVLGGVAASRERLNSVDLIPTDRSTEGQSTPQIDLLINYLPDGSLTINPYAQNSNQNGIRVQVISATRGNSTIRSVAENERQLRNTQEQNATISEVSVLKVNQLEGYGFEEGLSSGQTNYYVYLPQKNDRYLKVVASANNETDVSIIRGIGGVIDNIGS